MSLVINSNVGALQGQRSLANTQASQSQTFQRLSTGLRINSAKDDAGGLHLGQALTKDIRGLNMATRNAGDAISLAQTTEGALDQIQSNLQRINELAVQSANGTYNAASREGLQKEVNQLTQEIKRIAETTEFNGQKLLNVSAVSQTMQIGNQNVSGGQIKIGVSGGLVKANAGTAVAGIIACGLAATGTVNISTQAAAKTSISTTRNSIDKISELRATMGAQVNRFESVISGNQKFAENMVASRSRIMDADFAAETANLARTQVLQQAGISILGQANQAPQAALGLL